MNRIFKSFLVIALTALLCFAMAACGGEDAEEKNKSENKAKSAEEAYNQTDDETDTDISQAGITEENGNTDGDSENNTQSDNTEITDTPENAEGTEGDADVVDDADDEGTEASNENEKAEVIDEVDDADINVNQEVLTDSDEPAEEEPEDFVADASGEDGNISWRYDEDINTLIISGDGDMKDYSSSLSEKNYSPWVDYTEDIERIIIKKGVTSLGNQAFYNCQNLKELTVPSGIKRIGEFTFYGCKKLEKIELPNGITSIDSSAFGNCFSLTEFNIPNSVTYIGAAAFNSTGKKLSDGSLIVDNCLLAANPYEEQYYVDESIRLIAVGALSGYTEISVDEENPYYSSDVSVLFNKDRTVLLSYFYKDGDNSYTVPDGVKVIGDNAFESSVSGDIGIPSDGLRKVILPEGVTTIGKNAFGHCYFLSEINIPDSVTSIGDYAFQYCEQLNMTVPESVTDIGKGAFSSCYTLAEFTVPSGVTSISDYMLSDCWRLKKITVSDGTTSIGKYVFDGCINLKEVIIPDSVTFIDYSAFSRCDALTDVYFTGTEAKWQEISIGSSNESLTNATIHYNA